MPDVVALGLGPSAEGAPAAKNAPPADASRTTPGTPLPASDGPTDQTLKTEGQLLQHAEGSLPLLTDMTISVLPVLLGTGRRLFRGDSAAGNLVTGSVEEAEAQRLDLEGSEKDCPWQKSSGKSGLGGPLEAQSRPQRDTTPKGLAAPAHGHPPADMPLKLHSCQAWPQTGVVQLRYHTP
jgi:hypothetical protein